MMQQAVHVVISRMSFSGEKCFGNEAKWKEKKCRGALHYN